MSDGAKVIPRHQQQSGNMDLNLSKRLGEPQPKLLEELHKELILINQQVHAHNSSMLDLLSRLGMEVKVKPTEPVLSGQSAPELNGLKAKLFSTVAQIQADLQFQDMLVNTLEELA